MRPLSSLLLIILFPLDLTAALNTVDGNILLI